MVGYATTSAPPGGSPARVLIPALLAATLFLVSAAPATAPAAQEPTLLRGSVRDPVDDSPLAGVRVLVASRITHTAADGSFEVRVGRRRTGNLQTRFEVPGYLPYRTWTVAGTETTRTVYLFPDHPVRLDEHDEPVSPERLLEHFDIVHRDPIWRDPRRQNGWLWRWREQPRIFIASRVSKTVEDEKGWRRVATRKVPGKVRRHVRRVIERSIGPLTGGQLAAGRIRFVRMQEGEVVAGNIREYYRRGELHIQFTDTGYYTSGGGRIIEAHELNVTPDNQSSIGLDMDRCRASHSLGHCTTIVAGTAMLDLNSLVREIARGKDYLIKHEFAHVLGMEHRMPSTHGTTGSLLCSIMGGPCDTKDESIGAVSHADRVLARLAYTRSPGNDREDRDPEPGPSSE